MPPHTAIARHDDFITKASPTNLRKFGQFAVDLFGYPYDKDEVAKIAGRHRCLARMADVAAGDAGGG